MIKGRSGTHTLNIILLFFIFSYDELGGCSKWGMDLMKILK